MNQNKEDWNKKKAAERSWERCRGREQLLFRINSIMEIWAGPATAFYWIETDAEFEQYCRTRRMRGPEKNPYCPLTLPSRSQRILKSRIQRKEDSAKLLWRIPYMFIGSQKSCGEILRKPEWSYIEWEVYNPTRKIELEHFRMLRKSLWKYMRKSWRISLRRSWMESRSNFDAYQNMTNVPRIKQISQENPEKCQNKSEREGKWEAKSWLDPNHSNCPSKQILTKQIEYLELDLRINAVTDNQMSQIVPNSIDSTITNSVISFVMNQMNEGGITIRLIKQLLVVSNRSPIKCLQSELK